MIRWMIVIFLALMLISWFTPLLNKLGFGRLPGDFRFRLFGREWFIPLTTTLLLSVLIHDHRIAAHRVPALPHHQPPGGRRP
jgi:hypothetical protein